MSPSHPNLKKRFWTVAGYVIAYRDTPKPLTIIAALHGSRDIHSFLKDRI
ncbi:hypothetical protein [Edaphobacter sp.]|nr:hypothetical protein [Edaphobacter sp.]HEU5341845.1 hypothetical protein [Edaphobacter sp.]